MADSVQTDLSKFPVSSLLDSLQKAKATEKEWKDYRQALIAEIHRRLPVAEGKSSTTHTLEDLNLKVEVKASTNTTLADKDQAEQLNLHGSYPEAFPRPISFSKSGFNKLSADEQKRLLLTGVLKTSNPSLSVTTKPL